MRNKDAITAGLTTRRQMLSSLGVLSVGGGITNEMVGSTKGRSSEVDNVLEDGIWSIHYHDGYEEDAQYVRNKLQLASDAFDDDVYPHEYDLPTDVFLYMPEEWSMWLMTAGHWFDGNGEVTRSEVKMVTPSEHSLDDDRRDRWYTFGTTHEYVHLPQTRDLRFYNVDAPQWYVEGMAEYFARQYGVPAAGYEPTLRTNVDSQIIGGDGYTYMIAREEYDGAVRLIQFLAETYGPAEVAKLTRSGSRTLIEALSEDLGLAPLEFESEWLNWAEQNVGGSYETPLIEEFPDSLTDNSVTIQMLTDGAESSTGAGFVGESDYFTNDYESEISAGQPTTDDPVSHQPTPTHTHQFDSTLSIEYFDIHYYDEYESDAQLVAGWLEQLTDGYENFYSHPDITTDVYLYRNNELGHWVLGARPGDEIVFVTPSERDQHRSEEDRDFWIMRTLSRGYIRQLIARELPDSAAAPPFLTGGCGYYVAKEYTTDIVAERFERRKESFGRDARAGTAYSGSEAKAHPFTGGMKPTTGNQTTDDGRPDIPTF